MEHWNKKVAKNRGIEWNKKLVQGRLEARINPTIMRIFRVEKGLSQTKLASELGMTYATYGAIEAGKRAVKKEIADKISSVLVGPKGDRKIFKAVGDKKSRFLAIKSTK